MARLLLVTGGSRSGKSAYAQRLGESFVGPHGYLATCVPQDDEMRQRVARHQAARDPALWRTVEEPLALAAAVRREAGAGAGGGAGAGTRATSSRATLAAPAGLLLVECLTLWVSNLMAAAHDAAELLEEADVAGKVEELLGACAAAPGVIILVTAEVGLGVVPDHPVARRYCDLLGRCNQIIAAQADSVTLVTCGLPLILKGRDTP